MASDGRAVVTHPTGKTFFVDGAWIEEEGIFEITGSKGRVGFAKIHQLSKKSRHRIPSPCPYHGTKPNQCGGCPWITLDYSQQLAVKQKRVERQFLKLNHAFNQSKKANTIWASPNTLSYRNRAQLKTDGKKLGFVSGKTNSIIDIEQCHVLTERNNLLIRQLREQLPNRDWQPHRKSIWTTIDIDDQLNANNISVNKRLAFRQANDRQNEKMRAWLKRHLMTLNLDSSVLELFCGSGNFTEVISSVGFKEIVATEGSEEAIQSLRNKQLANVNAKVINLYQETAIKTLIKHCKNSSILILDPPREGIKGSVRLFEKVTSSPNRYFLYFV